MKECRRISRSVSNFRVRRLGLHSENRASALEMFSDDLSAFQQLVCMDHTKPRSVGGIQKAIVDDNGWIEKGTGLLHTGL